jgi:hypothetical protein
MSFFTSVKVTDGTNIAAVKAASTAAIATDPSLVIALSPNSSLPTGSNVIGHIILDSGTLTTITNVVKVAGNTGVALDAVLGATKPANVLQVGGNDGTNAYAIPLASGGASMVISGSVTQGTAAATTAGWPVVGGTVAVNSQTWVTTVSGTSASVNCTGYNTVIATFNGSGTISTGVATFEVSDDGGTTWFPISGKGPSSASTASTLTLTAALTAFQFNVSGFTNFRARNSTTITGSGGQSIVRVQASNASITTGVVVTQTTATNLKVGIAGNAGGLMDAVLNATPPANALQISGIAATALPSAATATNTVAPMRDVFGRGVVLPQTVRDLCGVQTTQIASSTSETTIVTAIASVFADITGLQITNQTGTAVTVTIKDSTSGTTRKVYDLAANGGIVVHFSPPLPQATVNNNWTATLSVNTVTVDVNVDYVKNK